MLDPPSGLVPVSRSRTWLLAIEELAAVPLFMPGCLPLWAREELVAGIQAGIRLVFSLRWDLPM